MKLWRLSDTLASAASTAYDISLVAEFSSSFGMRIMCVDASAEDEVILVAVIAMFLCYIVFFFLSTPIQRNEELRTQLLVMAILKR